MSLLDFSTGDVTHSKLPTSVRGGLLGTIGNYFLIYILIKPYYLQNNTYYLNKFKRYCDHTVQALVHVTTKIIIYK